MDDCAELAAHERSIGRPLSSWALGLFVSSGRRLLVGGCGKDAIGVIPTEWKGDNREYLRAKAMRLDIDVSDEELGAAVRRAMELMTS